MNISQVRGFLLRRTWLAPTLVTVVSALGLLQVEWAFRDANAEQLPGGYLLQEWSSEVMMQTMALKDMFAFGPWFFWYDHLYPPLEDILRYGLSLPDMWAGAPPNFQAVDLHLYLIYAWCFGLTNAVVYLWVRDLTSSSQRNGYFAGVITLLWAIAPGYLANMTLLDSTPLAMMFISWAFYFLYRFLRTRSLTYVSGFLAATLGASLARNITQIHVLAILVVFVVLTWSLARKRSAIIMALNVVLLGLLFVMPIKQYVMFGTTDTSTFSGVHRVGMLWIDPQTVPNPAFPDHIVKNSEIFQSKYNSPGSVLDNYRLSNGSYEAWKSDPLGSAGAMLKSLTITVPEALRPSSEYVDNLLVRELPWRGIYDWLFSGLRYLLIVFGSLAIVAVQRGVRGTGALLRRYGWFLVFYALIAAPVLWSNRFMPGAEDQGQIWTDAIRLKMFLEVPLVALVAYAVWALPSIIRRRTRATDAVPYSS